MQAPPDDPASKPAGRGLAAFFVLAYALAWSIWIPAAIYAPGAQGLAVAGAWAPTVAALVVASWTGGRAGLRRLLGGLLRWRAGAGPWAFAALAMPVLAAAALGVTAAFGGGAPSLAAVAARFGLPADPPWLFLVAAPLVYATTIFIGGPIAEELGWRGFAQPRLQRRIGAGPAGLVIGFAWSLWHLPLFVSFPAAVGGVPLALYVPMVTALGVAFAWLYARSGGSVPACILLHASVNFSLGILGAAGASAVAVFAALVVLLATGLLPAMPATRRDVALGGRGGGLS